MKHKLPLTEDIPGFFESIANMPITNKSYVDKSTAIAHKVHSRIKELGVTNKQLAEILNTTEQEIEEKCNQLYNLRTITKLEAFLNIELINIQKRVINNQ